MENNIEEKIIRAAKTTFLKKGFKDTNMADIATEVRFTRPAMHHYFRTKERLFQAVFEDIVMKFLPRIKDHISAQIPLEEKIKLIVDTYLKTIQDTPELPFFIITGINRNMDNMVALASGSGTMIEAVHSVFAALTLEMEEGRISQMLHLLTP